MANIWEEKTSQFWREIWIWVVVVLLQLYLFSPKNQLKKYNSLQSKVNIECQVFCKILQLELWLEPARLGHITITFAVWPQKSFNLYLVQLIEHPILQIPNILSVFWVFFPYKSFKLISKYAQKCQYNSLY